MNNHPEFDEGATMTTTLAKTDRQKHLKMGLTIHSKSGRTYLLGAPKPSKKEKEEEQQEEQMEQLEEEHAPVPTNHEESEAKEKLDDNATAGEATPFNDIVDLENLYPWNNNDLENPYPWEDGAAAGEIILVEEEQEKKQREESGAVPTVLNNWYWKNEKWISGTVTNHPRMDQGAQVSLIMAKSNQKNT